MKLLTSDINISPPDGDTDYNNNNSSGSAGTSTCSRRFEGLRLDGGSHLTSTSTEASLRLGAALDYHANAAGPVPPAPASGPVTPAPASEPQQQPTFGLPFQRRQPAIPNRNQVAVGQSQSAGQFHQPAGQFHQPPAAAGGYGQPANEPRYDDRRGPAAVQPQYSDNTGGSGQQSGQDDHDSGGFILAERNSEHLYQRSG